MAERSPPEDLMLAYVYGELSDAAARAFEERLAQEPELRAEVEGLLATRELIQADVRYGEESGQDEPPPHLLEAIVHAEALSRPPEIRRASAEGEGGGLLQRLTLWLVGSGLAVSAAAAFLLVAKSEAPPDPSGAAPAAEGARIDEAKPTADLREINTEAPSAAAPAGEAQTPPPGAAFAAETEADLDAPDAKADDARPRAKPMQPSEPLGGLGASSGRQQAKQEQEPKPRQEQKKKRDLAKSAFSPQPEPKPEPKELEEGIEAPGPERRSAEAADALADDSEASAAAPRAARRAPTTRGPPAIPKALSERLAQQRARRPAPPPKDKARADTERERRTERLQLSLATAERELEQGRPLQALELYEGVFRQDPRGALAGSVPVVGQMRALFALERHREVLSFLTVLERRPQDDVKVEGLWTAARSAEALGRLHVAEGLYRRLVAVKARESEAAAALSRVRAEKRRVRAPAVDSAPAEASER